MSDKKITIHIEIPGGDSGPSVETNAATLTAASSDPTSGSIKQVKSADGTMCAKVTFGASMTDVYAKVVTGAHIDDDVPGTNPAGAGAIQSSQASGTTHTWRIPAGNPLTGVGHGLMGAEVLNRFIVWYIHTAASATSFNVVSYLFKGQSNADPACPT